VSRAAAHSLAVVPGVVHYPGYLDRAAQEGLRDAVAEIIRAAREHHADLLAIGQSRPKAAAASQFERQYQLQLRGTRFSEPLRDQHDGHGAAQNRK